jgi:hypothetical protein
MTTGVPLLLPEAKVPNEGLAPMRARLGKKACELRMMLSCVTGIFILNDQIQRSVALAWLQHIRIGATGL